MAEKQIDTTPMVFDSIELIEVPVTIGQTEYTLREASGGAVAHYRNSMMKGMTFDPDTGKPIKVEGASDGECLLVHLCLFDKKNKRVPLGTVKEWKNSLVNSLFERAKTISDLDDDDEEVDEGEFPESTKKK